MAIQDELLKVIVPHFESWQREGEYEYELSLEASATKLRTKVSSMQVTSAVERMNLKDKHESGMSEFEEALGNILSDFIDATVATESTCDLQDAIDRVLSLIAAFGIPYSANVANAIISRALEFPEVLLERVRGHACLLLGKIAIALIKLRYDKKVDNEWIEEQLAGVEEALLKRLHDKAQAVRCHAIKAAGNFFVLPEDVETYEDLLVASLWNMAHDPSVSCRIVAVKSVPVNTTTMDSLVARVRDVKSKVRAEALQVLCKNPQAVADMTENQLMELIRSGLTKRCGGTKKGASKMICSGWMKSVKYDPIALLKLLGVMDNEAEANQVLDVIMDAAREEDSALLEELSDPEIRAYKIGIQNAAAPLKSNTEGPQPEQVFFLRARCKNVLASKDLTSAQKDAITSKLIPEVPLLCDLFENKVIKLVEAIDENDEEKEDKECFVCLQLLQLAEVADLKEEGSRRHFVHVMIEALSSVETPDDLVEGCINALKLACDREADLLVNISEVIGEIDKWQPKQEGGGEADGEMETMRLVRILSVLTVVLETATSKLSFNPTVKDFAKHIVPSVTHEDAMVREAAIGCFGKLGLFTDENTLICEFKPILLQVASCDDEKIEIRAQSLLALADWSMLFSETLTPCDVGDKTLSFPDIVGEMMDDARISAVCIAAEVAAKLLFSGRVCESEWFAKLITIFFDPRISNMKNFAGDIKEVGSPVRLQQLLTLFFPAVCLKGNNKVRDAMMASILPLLELVYVMEPAKLSTKSKKSRKKVAWPVSKMINYVCSMVENGRPKENDEEATIGQNDEHGDPRNTTAFVSVAPTVAVDSSSTSLLASLGIAEFLANHSEHLTSVETRALCKILGAANFGENEEDRKNLISLKQFMEEIGTALSDATSLKSLVELNVVLTEIDMDEDEAKEVKEGSSKDEEDDEKEDEVAAEDEAELDLSEDLITALGEFKISESDDDSLIVKEKENSGAKGKRSSRGKSSKARSSGGSAARRSRLRHVN